MSQQEEKKAKRVNLFLKPELVIRAKKKALDEDISLSELVNRLIDSNCPEE